ncbi:MAG: ankyrin repeat domain-containing protein [Elusimicrobiota bacterium]|jgi:hypothetical protein|nr:ankyrin repeat domain-containing protein [Elusimicrobiota bacterium]
MKLNPAAVLRRAAALVLFVVAAPLCIWAQDGYKNVMPLRDFRVFDSFKQWIARYGTPNMSCTPNPAYDVPDREAPKYSPVYNKENGRRIYNIFEYIDLKGPGARVKFIQDCCASVNCKGGYHSDYDGNTLPLAAAQYNNLDALEYFAKELDFLVDIFWRETKTYAYDVNGRSELMHAIANNNLDMVKFLLGRQEDKKDAVSGAVKKGNKVRYSNPRRRAPHSSPALHFKHDARDFARWHKGRIDDRIIKLVEEVWQTSGSYENDGELQRKNAERYEKEAVFALLTPERIKERLKRGIDKKMRHADYAGAAYPYGGDLQTLLSGFADRS